MKHLLICDDDPQILASLREQVDRIWTEPHDTNIFSSREDLMRFLSCQRTGWQFILLLDILLKEESSIPSSAKLMEHMPNLKVIYITGHIEYCEDIFFSRPTGFLVKPVNTERLLFLLKKASRELDEETGRLLRVFTPEGEPREIPTHEIFYLESAGRVITIHAMHDDVKCARKLDELEQSMPYGFLRCHQSYLVNCDYIQATTPRYLILKSGQRIPIAKGRRDKVREFLFHLAAESL